MASVTIQVGDQRAIARLNGRVLIGRWTGTGITVDDPTVSRVHAAIYHTSTGYSLLDLGSKTGVLVNKSPVSSKHSLSDKDEIRIGPAVITFRLKDPSKAKTVSDRISLGKDSPVGMLVQCTCGAPVWSPAGRLETFAICRACGRANPVIKHCAAPTKTNEQLCSICQWPLLESDSLQSCPSCGLKFHSDCWFENEGCSAYGCASANIVTKADENPDVQEPSDDPEPVQANPLESLLLIASVPALVISAFTFGIPSLITGLIVSAIVARERSQSQSKLIALSLVCSFIGLAGGGVVSYFWWLANRTAILHVR